MKTKLTLLLLLILTSCSSTQKTKSKSVEESKTESFVTVKDKTETETKTDETTNVKVNESVATNNNVVTKTKTYEPIDNTKPAVATNSKGEKINLDNAKYTESETIDLSNENKKVDTNIVNDKKIDTKQKNDVNLKAKDKTDSKKVEANKIVKRDPTKQIIVIGVLIVGAVVFLAWWFLGIGKRRNKSDEKTI